MSIKRCLVITIITTALANLHCPPPPTSGIFACRNRRLHEVPLPIGAPIKNRLAINTLDVSHNFIQLLHEDALRPYPALTCLRVEHNLIWKITDLAFHAVPRLERLLLRGNRLLIQPGSLSPQALQGLAHLKQLDLSENPLGQLPVGFFPPSLLDLRVDQTQPNLVFQPRAIAEASELQRLSLVNNSFKSLPLYLDEELRSLKHLSSLNLGGNPWDCDCHLAWLAQLTRNLNDSSKGVCHQPREVQGQLIDEVSLSEFQCAPVALNKESVKAEGVTEVEVGSTVSMVCHFYAEPRGRVRWLWSPIEGGGRVEIQTLEKGVTEQDLGEFLVKTNLTLREVRAGTDDGVYQCEAENARGRDEVIFRLRVGYESVWLRTQRGLFRPFSVTWVGAIVGGVLLVSLTLLTVVLYCCRYDRTHREPPRRIVIKEQQDFDDVTDAFSPTIISQTEPGAEMNRMLSGGLMHYRPVEQSAWFTNGTREIERLH